MKKIRVQSLGITIKNPASGRRKNLNLLGHVRHFKREREREREREGRERERERRKNTLCSGAKQIPCDNKLLKD